MVPGWPVGPGRLREGRSLMADQGEPKLTDRIEEQKPKLVDAIKGQVPDVVLTEGSKSGHPTKAPDKVTGSEVPENAPHNAGFQSRDDYLVHIGRGHDTSGRGGQKG